MKFRAKVTGARTEGGSLVVNFKTLDVFGWRPAPVASIAIDDPKTTRAAMYIGREVDIEITPRRSS